MKKLVFTAIAFLGILLFSNCGGNSGSANKKEDGNQEVTHIDTEQDFDAFWTTFRKATLENNKTEIEKRVRYPFLALGPMDNDEPIIYENFNHFYEMFEKFLESPTGLNPSNFNETQKQYIQLNEKIVFNEFKLPTRTDTTANVAAMGFANENKGWKLVMVYLDEDNYTQFSKPAHASR